MSTHRHPSERGQALVLLVISFIALLGFAALAIDGGMVYSDRRYAQNASDASSLAGGGIAALSMENSYVGYQDFDCADGRVIAAESAAKAEAISRAGSNDFSIDTDTGDKNGVETACVDDYDNGSYVEKYIDVSALISDTTQTSFAQFIYRGPMINNVDAITRVRPPTPVAFGNAIVSLATDCDEGGIVFEGNPYVYVTGGGIFSNSCIDVQGNTTVEIEPAYSYTCVEELPDPGCFVKRGGSGEIIGDVEEGTGIPLPPEVFEVPEPDCSSVPSQPDPTGDVTINPGRYSSRIRINNNQVITMNPGLYCLGNGITVNGGGTLTGNGVTIFVQSGNFATDGGATVNIAAPENPCAVCPPALDGVLIYLAQGNHGEVDLHGNSDSDYTGLVYAPDGYIDAGGTSSEISTIHAQLVAYDVKIHGTTDIVVNYDDELNYIVPANLELFK